MSAIAPTITQKEQKTFRSPLCTVCVLQALWAEPCRPCHGGFLCCVVTSSRLFDGRLCCPSMMIRAPPPPTPVQSFTHFARKQHFPLQKTWRPSRRTAGRGIPPDWMKEYPCHKLEPQRPIGMYRVEAGLPLSAPSLQGGHVPPPPPGGRVDDKRHLYGSSAKPSHQIRLYLFPPNIGQPPRGTLPEQFT